MFGRSPYRAVAVNSISKSVFILFNLYRQKGREVGSGGHAKIPTGEFIEKPLGFLGQKGCQLLSARSRNRVGQISEQKLVPSAHPENLIFPTLVDLCALTPPPQALEGRSLRPLLEDPAATWDRPALTTYGEGYFSARDERFRYIRYPDHTEELYDHQADPHEFRNLATDPDHRTVKERLGQYVPTTWARNLGGRRG